MTEHKIYSVPFSRIYPLYLQKVERKGRSRPELDEVITWLTGYSIEKLQDLTKNSDTLREFFNNAPSLNDNAHKITGVICGVRVEEIEDPLMQKIRWMDKLVDELSKGKVLEKILRK